jgi:hypothetical protein
MISCIYCWEAENLRALLLSVYEILVLLVPQLPFCCVQALCIVCAVGSDGVSAELVASLSLRFVRSSLT